MASLADMLSKGLGSKLEGNNHDTIKEDKKNPKKSSNEIIPKNQHQLWWSNKRRMDRNTR